MEPSAVVLYSGDVKYRPNSAEIGRRLRLLECAVEGDSHGASSRMARRLGLSVQNWTNVKMGRGLSTRVLLRLTTCIPGLSAEWVLSGRAGRLDFELAQHLGLVEWNDDGWARRAVK